MSPTENCPHCGYDARGNSGATCPECGRDTSAAVPARTRPFTVAVALICWVPVLISVPYLLWDKVPFISIPLALTAPLAFIATLVILLAAVRRAQEDRNHARGWPMDVLLLAGAWSSVLVAHLLIPFTGILDV